MYSWMDSFTQDRGRLNIYIFCSKVSSVRPPFCRTLFLLIFAHTNKTWAQIHINDDCLYCMYFYRARIRWMYLKSTTTHHIGTPQTTRYYTSEINCLISIYIFFIAMIKEIWKMQNDVFCNNGLDFKCNRCYDNFLTFFFCGHNKVLLKYVTYCDQRLFTVS